MITSGIYKYSRNPAFLGFDFMYISVCLIFCNWATIIFTLFAIIMLHLQILGKNGIWKKDLGRNI